MNKLQPPSRNRILIVSGFTETSINSFREIQYPRALAQRGWRVSIFTSDQSYIWRFNRARLPQTNPCVADDALRALGVQIHRRRPLIRISDFLVLLPSLRLLREADLVHIVEFRQGFSVAVALFAKLLGKPVVYDHEQRGDRNYSWLHRADSAVRRLCIGVGSLFVDVVRHTVHANRDHFHKCAWRNVRTVFSPLAADERVFGYDPDARSELRSSWKLDAKARVAVFSGKLDAAKRSDQAIKALVDLGWYVVAVGRVPDAVRASLEQIPNVRLISHVSPKELNRIYSAADLAVFTTFSISYWEALATGLKILVPRTTFSESSLSPDHAILFGRESMFVVPEEQYQANADIYRLVRVAAEGFTLTNEARTTRPEFTWPAKGAELDSLYRELLETSQRGR